ncbi:dienelactone hydrolase [Spongiactinospora gelatinilytica]|uniref:Dienelactone hydrolase n=1 Tax=Spongiactinospora gelatinilytica TaxID=2666298 RepID=A0A2W2F9N4_9ACTN|nr:dienelactone hydrolase family protein [Spongiactinospora gelatinilytica]PZG26249.1 dienelactone hydrolase [Spongiactinospora gelatinilytica]
MAEIVLLHSALGLRRGVEVAAGILRDAGHIIHAPDYYDGEVFDELDAGLRKRDAVTYPELFRRWKEIGEGVVRPVVFAGFSLGALLFHSGVPVREVTDGGWPAGVPVQVHYTEGDPFVEEKEIAELRTDVGERFERFVYPGDAHLFADPDLPGYSADSAVLMWRRVLDVLSRESPDKRL